jgi:hypothetical protein
MYTQTVVQAPIAQKVIDEGLRHGMHFANFEPKQHEGWREEPLKEDSQYTKKPLIRQRMKVVELACPQVEWFVWHEPPKPAPEPKPVVERPLPLPFAPGRPLRDERRGGIPIAAWGALGVLVVGLAIALGPLALLAAVPVDPILVARCPDGELVEVATWYEIS